MKIFTHTVPIRRLLVLSCLALSLLACALTGSTPPTDTAPNADTGGLSQTQTAIVVQQTSVSLQQTSVAITQNVPQQQPTQQISFNATDTPLAPVAPAPLPAPLPASPPQPQPTPATQAGGFDKNQFEQWMKNAQILVFEDVVAEPRVELYIKDLLKEMDMQFTWHGNAIGRIKNAMRLGVDERGEPWDLVILASEARTQISGEYFDYLQDVLDQNTPVIIENWYLEDIDQGRIKPILRDCGVTISDYPPRWHTVNDVEIWQIGDENHPLLNQPNTIRKFTPGISTWVRTKDLGSKITVSGTGDAQLLAGTDALNDNSEGVLAVCLDGQVILQTFSSHSYPYLEVAKPVWENYIYNALLWRYQHR